MTNKTNQEIAEAILAVRNEHKAIANDGKTLVIEVPTTTWATFMSKTHGVEAIVNEQPKPKKAEQFVKITSIDSKLATCGRCGGAIRWAKTIASAKMPVQPEALSRYAGTPAHDETTGIDYWPVPASLTHFPHCNSQGHR